MRIVVAHAAGAVRARRRRGARGAADRGAERSAGTRPRSSPCRSSGIRASACSTQRVRLAACSTSRRSTGRKVDLVIATKFPSYVVRHPNKRRLARAPVPPGVRPRPHRARPVRRERRRPRGARARSSELDRRTLGEARAPVRDLAERRRPPARLARARGRGRPAAAAGARLPLRGVRRLRALRRPARPGEARRPAARGGRGGPVAARRRRRRRARPRAARASDSRAHKLNGRVEFRGRVDADELADLYARCRRGLLRAVDEDFGMVPYEAFLVGEARRDDDRRRRAARRRRRPPHRARRPSRAAAALADALRLPARAPRRRRAPGAAPARPSPSASPGTPRSTACSS